MPGLTTKVLTACANAGCTSGLAKTTTVAVRALRTGP